MTFPGSLSQRYKLLLLSMILLSFYLFRVDKIILWTNAPSSYHPEEARPALYRTTDDVGMSRDDRHKVGVSQTLHTTATAHDPPVPTARPTPSHPSPPPYVVAANISEAKRRATVVVQLSGEMANNLQHIAHGIGLQEWARQEYDIETNLVIRHFVSDPNRLNNGKWRVPHRDIQKCFPSTLGTWDWSQGNTNEFLRLQALQQQWLGTDRYDRLTGLVNSYNVSDLVRGMEYFAANVMTDPDRPYVDPDSPIQLPFLLSITLDVYPMVDRYLKEIRRVFAFDNSACCRLRPTPTETVFHFRNYMSEMPDWRAYSMGFSELSPQKVVHELFGGQGSHRGSHNRTPDGTKRPTVGDHVTVVSRIPNKYARAYAEAFQNELGVTSSLISNQTGVQDFCFLKEATYQLVGNARSTFVFWAAILSTTVQTVRLYHVDTIGLRERHPNYWGRFTYQWTNPELADKIHFELYQSEEVDHKEGPNPL